MTYEIGGNLYLRAHHYESGSYNYIEDADFYAFFVDRSIINSNRIETNYQNGKYYYNQEYLYFKDRDFNQTSFQDLSFEVFNLETRKYSASDPSYYGIYIKETGKYRVTIKDNRKNETREYTFAIDRIAPIIQLYEWNWMVETPKLSGGNTSYGMKVIYADNLQVNTITYKYTPPVGRIELGTMPNEQIFWRKGHYTITATDMVGNQTTSTFTITDYDLMVDPVGATVGTEVTMNNGAYLDTTMHVGYTRCIYLGVTAPSQSRLDYFFFSSDDSIATVSAYGTITAHKAGTVIITSVDKNDVKIGRIILTVLP